ncbi:heat-inducible transcriptional repressor HrcA [Hirschia maritima]|uniref:heat-inducible transcriptional repressor HrcA n=1 Tax=Hirschia maritima TaxID=1121961 RepID=UPI0006873067
MRDMNSKPSSPQSQLSAMDERSRTIFREIVDAYLETGEPVGSRTIARRGISLSSASIRNVMADLAEQGLLDSPHTSAGRLPTHQGLRLFVDGLMEVQQMKLGAVDKRKIQQRLSAAQNRPPEDFLGEASELLSGLVGGAGLVASPKSDGSAIKHVEFVSVGPGQALAVIVSSDDDVENRLISLPDGMPLSALQEASNYLNARLRGKTLSEVKSDILTEVREKRAQLDEKASTLVEAGMAHWTGEDPIRGRSLIIRGRANLLGDEQLAEDVDKVRDLFSYLDKTESLIQVLDRAHEAEGVRLFIGAENKLFSLSGSSVIVAPYMNSERKVVGALGVIGPTRLNYARVIPMVDYTAQVVGRLLDGGSTEKLED